MSPLVLLLHSCSEGCLMMSRKGCPGSDLEPVSNINIVSLSDRAWLCAFVSSGESAMMSQPLTVGT